MLVDKANLTAHVAAKDRCRYAFNGIGFNGKGTVSSDGKILLSVPYPDADPEDFPVVDGIDLAAAGPEDTRVVPVKTCDRVAKRLPNGNAVKPILRNAAVQFDGERVKLGTTDLECAEVSTSRLIDGKTPDYARCIPEDVETVFAFDVGLMKQLCAAMEKAFKARDVPLGTVTLEVSTDPDKRATSPVVLRHTSASMAGEMIGVIMPVTLKGSRVMAMARRSVMADPWAYVESGRVSCNAAGQCGKPSRMERSTSCRTPRSGSGNSRRPGPRSKRRRGGRINRPAGGGSGSRFKGTCAQAG